VADYKLAVQRAGRIFVRAEFGYSGRRVEISVPDALWLVYQVGDNVTAEEWGVGEVFARWHNDNDLLVG